MVPFVFLEVVSQIAFGTNHGATTTKKRMMKKELLVRVMVNSVTAVDSISIGKYFDFLESYSFCDCLNLYQYM